MYSGEVELFEVAKDTDRLILPSYTLFDYFFNLGIRDPRGISDEMISAIYECESLDELENIIYDNCLVRNYSWDLSEDTDDYTEFYGIAFSHKPEYIMRVYKDE